MKARRELLATIAAGVGAGCTTRPFGDPTSTASATSSETTGMQPTDNCDGWNPIEVPVEVVSPKKFELSVATERVSYGDRLTVTLENTTEKEESTGNRSKLDIQVKSEGEWESVLYAEGTPIWNDLGIPHAPGEGFEWNIELGPGVKFAKETNPPLQACDDVVPGTYRFVYWGVSRDVGQNREASLVAQFRLEES